MSVKHMAIIFLSFWVIYYFSTRTLSILVCELNVGGVAIWTRKSDALFIIEIDYARTKGQVGNFMILHLVLTKLLAVLVIVRIVI